MKRIIIVLLSMMAINASAQQYESRGDIQFPQMGLTDLQFMEGGYVPLTGILLQNGKVYTNISTLSCTFMYGYSPTSTAFVIVTNVSKIPTNGSFSMPVAASDTATNGHFWYTLKYTTADGKPFFTGTGTLEIVHTTAGGSPSAIRWQTPVNWEGFVYTNGQTAGPVLPGSNVLTRPGPNGSYYIDAQVLQLVDVAQEAIDTSSSTNRALSDTRYIKTGEGYDDADATNAVVTAFPGIKDSAKTAIHETNKVDISAWQASNNLLQANINAAQGLATMGGDVTGPSTNATVIKIQNVSVDDLNPGSPEDGYGLKWDNAQGKLVLGPVASVGGNSVSNLLVISNTATATDVPTEKIGFYRVIRPGDLPAMVANVGGYEVCYFDLTGITLNAGTIALLNNFLTVNPAAYDGSLTAPAYTWDDDRDMGKYRMSYLGAYAECYVISSNRVWFWAADGIHLTNGAAIFGMNYDSLTNKPNLALYAPLATLGAHITSNSVDHSSFQSQIGTNNAAILVLQSQIVSNNMELVNSNLTAHIVSNAAQHVSYQAQISSNDVDITGLGASISSNIVSIAGLSSNLSSVITSNSTAHSSYQAQISSNDVDITNLGAGLGSNNVSIAGLSSNLSSVITSNSTAHSSYQAQISSNDVDITNLGAGLGSNNVSIAGLSSNLSSVITSNSTAHSSYQAQISSNDVDITGLSASFGSNNVSIAGLSSNISSHVTSNNASFQNTSNAFLNAVSNWSGYAATAPIRLGPTSQGIIQSEGVEPNLIAALLADNYVDYQRVGAGFIGCPTNGTSAMGDAIIIAGGYNPNDTTYRPGRFYIQQNGSMGVPYAENNTPAIMMDTNCNWNWYSHYHNDMRMGQAAGYMSWDTNGQMTASGLATTFDDVMIPASALGNNTNTTTTFVPADVSWQFEKDSATNSANDMLYGNLQLSHRYKPASAVDVHIHWYQPTVTNSSYTNWYALMRWNHNGEAPGSWLRVHGTNVFGGNTSTTKYANVMQITGFRCPPGYTNANYSSILDVKIEYDGSLGHDVPLQIKSLDAHIECDRLGTKEEYD